MKTEAKAESPFRTAYGPKMKQVFECVGPSLARQDMKDECDINHIMAKYRKTGLVQHVAMHQGQYGEFAAIDYHEAMNAVVEADEMFQTVPSEIRAKFNNDPGAFLEYVTNAHNEDGMRELGLLPAKKPEDSPKEGEPGAGDAG